MRGRRFVFVPALCSLLAWLALPAAAAPPALDEPLIVSLSPVEGQVGRQVLISGVNFGSAPEVRFAGVVAPVLANRTDLGRLVATVPTGATSGAVTVRDTIAGKTSNAAEFALLAGAYTPVCTISGAVTDPGAAAVAGALVVALDPATTSCRPSVTASRRSAGTTT